MTLQDGSGEWLGKGLAEVTVALYQGCRGKIYLIIKSPFIFQVLWVNGRGKILAISCVLPGKLACANKGMRNSSK
jgi:hypothetical protein